MDADSQRTLAQLLRTQRVAALGTLRDGMPFVSSVGYAAAPDFAAFYLHVSGLAYHTQALRQDPRVGLLISEPDTGTRNLQTLARISLCGQAEELPRAAADYAEAESIYLAKLPQAHFNFGLADFVLVRIRPTLAPTSPGLGRPSISPGRISRRSPKRRRRDKERRP